MRRLNFVYLLSLMISVAVVSGGAYLLHGWQMKRQTPAVLTRAQAQEAAGDGVKALESYRTYLALEPQDVDAWRGYVRLVDQEAAHPGGDGRVYMIYEQALRVIGEDEELEIRCIDLAMEIGRYGDAKRRLDLLIKRLERKADATLKVAELEERMGRCLHAERKFDDAERWYRRSIARTPGRVPVRETLAGMLRRDLKRSEAADVVVEEMVSAADRRGEALAARWRHRREFGLEVDPQDALKAVELEPRDPGVLLVAARAALDAGSIDLARERLAQGSRLAPDDRAFPLIAARLESALGRRDEAEDLLRKAEKAIPGDLEIQVALVESLITQGKLDGEDGAGARTARLASSGLVEGYVRFLEGQALIQRGRWREALGRLGSARALLVKNQDATERIELLLAECHARLGSDEESLVSLRRAAEKSAPGDGARLLLAGALEKAGRIDEAIEIHREFQAERPQSRIDELRLLILQQTALPIVDRAWNVVEDRLKAAETALPGESEALTLLRAEMLAARDRRGDATALLEAASRREPERLPYRLALAELTLRGGEAPNPQAALAILDLAAQDLGDRLGIRLARIDAVAALPTSEATARLAAMADELDSKSDDVRIPMLERLASAFARNGDLDKADELLAEVGRARPDDLNVLLARADAALLRNDHVLVREIVGRIKELEGDQGVQWRYVEASSLVQRLATEPEATRASLQTAAVALVQDLITRRKDWWGGFLLRGRLAELEGRLDAAATDYVKAVEAGSSQPGLARRTVLLLSELGRTQQSDEIARLLALRDPSFEGLRLSEAQNALRAGDYDRAVALTRKIIPETSRNPFDLLFLARVLTAAGRRTEAEKPLRRALEAAPTQGAVWIPWIRHLAELDRVDEVSAALERLEKSVDPKAALLTMAIARSTAGDDVGAAPLFASALRESPDDLGTIRAAAEFYVKVLDLEAARPLVDRLIDPRTEAGPESVAWARRASALLVVATGDSQRIDQAIALVEENLKPNPLAADDRRARAILLTMHPDRREEGVSELEALHTQRRLGRDDRFLLARFLDERGDREKWDSTMSELLADPEPDLAHVLAYARRKIELGDFAASAKSLTLARPRGDEAEAAVLETRCRLLQAQNRSGEIPAMVATQVERRPGQQGALGFLLESFGFHDQAERALRGFAAQAPDDPIRKLVLAQFLVRHQRLDESLTLFESAAESAPANVKTAAAANILGNAKSATPQIESRLAALVERVAADVESTDGLMLLATLRVRQGSYEDAESIYQQVLSQNPDDIRALNDLAWLLAFLPDRGSEALSRINRAIELAGPASVLLDTRSMAHMNARDYDAAIHDLRQALASEPEKAASHFHLAMALRLSGDDAGARRALDEAKDRGFKLEAVGGLEHQAADELVQALAAN